MRTVTVSLWFTSEPSWHFERGRLNGQKKDLSMYSGSLKEGSPMADRAHAEPPRESADLTLTGSNADPCAALSAMPLPHAAAAGDDRVAHAQACQMLQLIRVAREFFPAMRDLADHPGWEILLHLFIAGRESRTVTTAELCERTGTWRPLAIRYTEMLFERGLIDRDVSAEKPDAWALSLTASTEARLRELLCGFARGFREPAMGGATN